MSDELKPCPFCRLTENQIKSDEPFKANNDNFFWVRCHSCDADGPLRKMRADAVFAWNAAQLSKPRLPWRKVSEEPLPKDGQWFLAIRINSHLPPYASMCFWSDQYGDFIVGPIPGATHWCYFDELKPEDAE